jgi:hypothetical protein
MSRAARLALVLFLGIAPLTIAAPADAQSKSVQARDHVRAGLAYAERDKWDDALREFEEAYALEPQPLRLYDVAQARLKTRRFRAARDAFSQLLELPGLSADQRERARAGLASASEHVAKLRITVEGGKPTDSLTLDGTNTGVQPGKPLEIDPGRRVVRLIRDGEPVAERTVDVSDGGDVAVTIGPGSDRIERAPPPATAPDTGGSIPPLVFVLGGAALVSAGVGTYFEIRGLNRWSELRDGCGRTRTCPPGEVDAARRNVLVGDLLIGVAVVAAAAAVYVLLAPGKQQRIGSALLGSGLAF